MSDQNPEGPDDPSPEEILRRMEKLIAEAGNDRQTPTPEEDLHPQVKDHLETIRRQAENHDSESEARDSNVSLNAQAKDYRETIRRQAERNESE